MTNIQNLQFYQVSSQISTDINREILGDKTNRSISLQTTHGFKNITRSNLHDDVAVEVIHALMVASLIAISRKDDRAKIIGAILIICLILFYCIGKNVK